MGMSIRNALIESVEITDSDRGILDAWLHLNYGSSGQGFGGYALYLPKSFSHHKLESVAGHFIWRCMEIGGVTKWSNLKGKTIRVDTDGDFGQIKGIGHIVKDDWFYPEVDFAALKNTPTPTSEGTD
jgi:hypothetical protein